jgi:hypothetical protein
MKQLDTLFATKSTEEGLKKTIRCLKAAKEDNGQLIDHQNQKRNIPGIRRKL